MKKSEYPQRQCRLPVHGEHADWPCELPENHDDGPCATPYIPASVAVRDNWEDLHPAEAYQGSEKT